MSKLIASILVLTVLIGCKPPEASQSKASDTVPHGAEEPEQLAERFFKALQTNDVDLALSTFPTEEAWRQHLAGDSDLPLVLEMTSTLDARVTAAFAKIQRTIKQDGFNLRTAKAVDIKVNRREAIEGDESFGSIVLGIEVHDLHVIYEIEFDDGSKLGDRWFFTDNIRELRRITLL